MDSTALDNLKPRVSRPAKPMLVAGIGERYNHCETTAPAFPASGSAFTRSVDNIPDRVGKVAYGVCCNGDDSGNFDYIAGVEVSDFSDLPREFSRVRIPEQQYAVFTHREHISTIRRTVNTIWNHWLPASGMKAADAPNFERYDEKFDPAHRQWRARNLDAGARSGLLAAGLPCAVLRPAACLASDIDFAITSRNEMLRVRDRA